jgi:hypothetical protein
LDELSIEARDRRSNDPFTEFLAVSKGPGLVKKAFPKELADEQRDSGGKELDIIGSNSRRRTEEVCRIQEPLGVEQWKIRRICTGRSQSVARKCDVF